MTRIEPDSQNRLSKLSAIDTFQIRSISTARFIKKVGLISPDLLSEIKTAVKAVIDAD
jgi:mRNA interferase MazF